MTSPDLDLLALVESLRQEVRGLRERINPLEEGFDAIEAGFAAATDLDTRSVSDEPADVDEQTAGDGQGDDVDEELVENPAPTLEVLHPWVEANVSSWCERRMAEAATSTRGVKWCPRWYEHPEAITRLWCMRAAQIQAATEGPVAVAGYLRDVFDHHMTVLTSADGPFHNCTLEKHLYEVLTAPRFLPTSI